MLPHLQPGRIMPEATSCQFPKHAVLQLGRIMPAVRVSCAKCAQAQHHTTPEKERADLLHIALQTAPAFTWARHQMSSLGPQGCRGACPPLGAGDWSLKRACTSTRHIHA